MAQAVGRLKLAVRRLVKDPWESDELLSNLLLRLARALSAGVSVRSFEAFLFGALPQELLHWRRQQIIWRRRVGAEAQAVGGGWAAVSIVALTDEDLQAIARWLAPPLGGWLTDMLSGDSDRALAGRDGVSEAAVRKRWSRLRSHFDEPRMLEKILDFLVTGRRRRAPLGSVAAAQFALPHSQSDLRGSR